MKINNRLKQIGDLVEANSFCLDVGCDHALLDIYLVKKNKNILKEARRKSTSPIEGFPRGTVVNNLPANAGDTKDVGSIRGWGKIPWNRKWQPTLAFLTGKFHGQRSLEGYSPWGRKDSDITECAHT